MPVLDADGKILSQTSAMAVYAAKLAGMHPEDAWDAAKVDECISGCTDQPLRKDEHELDVAEYHLGGREVLILTGKG